MPTPAPTMPRLRAVAEENAHDAAAGGAERFQDADVAGLLDDDHEEDRQDAEAGDGDDQEQQHVEHGRFHLHGGQQRALLVAPGADLVTPAAGSSARSRSRTMFRSTPGLSWI